ncbi:MAG: hypothetical protein QXT25_04665, partial [Candidatus Anstonellaceae archaeon]
LNEKERMAVRALRDVIRERQGIYLDITDIATGIAGNVAITAAYLPKIASLAQAMRIDPSKAQNAANIADNLVQTLAASEFNRSTEEKFIESAAVPLVIAGALSTPSFIRLFQPTTSTAQKNLADKATEFVQKTKKKVDFELKVFLDKAREEANKDVKSLSNIVITESASIDPVQLSDFTKEIIRRAGYDPTSPVDINKFLQQAKAKPAVINNLIRETSFQRKVDAYLAEAIPSINGNYELEHFKRLADIFSSSMFNTKIYDKKYGLNSNGVLLAMQTNYRASAIVQAEQHTIAYKKLKEIQDEMKKYNLSFEDIYDGKTDIAVKLKEEVGKIFEGFYQFYRNLGINIEKVDGVYIPRMAKPIEEAIPALEKYFNIKVSDLTPKNMHSLAATNDEFRKSIEILTGVNVVDIDTAKKSLNLLITNIQEAAEELPSTVATRMLFTRTGDIPVFLIDKNIPRVTSRYITAMSYAAYIEKFVPVFDSFAETVSKIDAAQGIRYSAGAEFYKYLARQIKEQPHVGIGRAVDTFLKKSGMQIREKAARMMLDGDTKKAERLRLAADFVEGIVPAIKDASYSAFLGLGNIKASVQNMLTPAIAGIDRIGVMYGSELVLRGLKNAVKNLYEEMPMIISKGAVENVPRHIQDMNRGIIRDKSLREKIDQLMMLSFNITERFSYHLSKQMGAELAKDAIRSADKRAVLASLAGDEKLVERYINAVKTGRLSEKQFADYCGEVIIANGQLQFNNSMKAEFAAYLGSLGQFTRYPAESAGILNYTIRTKDPKIIARSTAFFSLLALGDSMLANDDGKIEGFSRLLLGSSGLSGMHPYFSAFEGYAKNLMGQTEASKYTPPIVSQTTKIVRYSVKAATADDEDIRDANLERLVKTGASIVPMASALYNINEFIRRIEDDE